MEGAGIGKGIALCLPAAGRMARGQTTTTPSGVIKDTTGAVLPGATIGIKRPGTGMVRVAVTYDSCVYCAPALESGSCEIRAEMAGFQSEVRFNRAPGSGERREDVWPVGSAVRITDTAASLSSSSSRGKAAISGRPPRTWNSTTHR